MGISGGEWSASWEMTKSSKVVYLLTRLQQIGAAPPPPSAAPCARDAGEQLRMIRLALLHMIYVTLTTEEVYSSVYAILEIL